MRTGEAKQASPTSARRGFLLLTVAKLLFVALGFVVQFGLPRVLGSPSEFGLLSLAMAFTAILTNAMTSSMVQTSSKLVAEHGPLGRTLAARHGLISLALGLALLALGPWLGASVLRDAALVPLLRASSVVICAYGFYATAIGSLNGAQRFETQALLDGTFSTVRTLGLLGGALILHEALGAMSGFASAALVMAVVGVLAARLMHAGEGRAPSWRVHAALLAPIALYQLALNGVLQLDLEALKLLANTTHDAAGSEVASHEAGLYRAAQTLAFVPYQLMTSITLVLFPIVSRANALGDVKVVEQSVRGALRFSWLFLGALLAPLVGAAHGAVRVAFPAAYADAADVIPVLALSQFFFALAVLHATILVGQNLALRVSALAVLALAVGLSASVVLATYTTFSTLPIRVALGTALGSLVFFLATKTLLATRLQARVPSATVLRLALAGAAAIGVGRVLPQASLVLGLMSVLLAGLAYMVVLVLTGEITREDLKRVRPRA